MLASFDENRLAIPCRVRLRNWWAFQVSSGFFDLLGRGITDRPALWYASAWWNVEFPTTFFGMGDEVPFLVERFKRVLMLRLMSCAVSFRERRAFARIKKSAHPGLLNVRRLHNSPFKLGSVSL
jgi:hypothetical protein